MTRTRFLKTAGVISAFAAIILVAMLNNSSGSERVAMTSVTRERNQGFDGPSRSSLFA
jgi:hypothetical protein